MRVGQLSETELLTGDHRNGVFNHSDIGVWKSEAFQCVLVWITRTTYRRAQAKALRARIKAKECYCTNEVFLWPSIVFQPLQLAKALVGAKELQTRQDA